MDVLQQFLQYAGDFEKTLADDDWSRLHRYFAEDAVYVVEADAFGCRLTGPDAIFAGIKKSLDGFDRKFSGRSIEVTSGPEIDGNEMRMEWAVVYEKEGLPPFVLRGRSTARFQDDKITYLCDSYDPSVGDDLRKWQQANTGIELNPAYT